MKTLTKLLTLLAILVVATNAVFGQESRPSPGILTGLVTNAATGDFLISARIDVGGIPQRIVTLDNGRYRIVLPAGEYSVTASFTGLDAALKTTTIASGQTTVLDFALNSEIYELDEFQVRTLREEDALSLQQQRYSDTIKTVVAASAYGTPADNPGELIQRIPGINLDYVQGEPIRISIRGMDVNFAKVTMDGDSLALSQGNLNSPNRSFHLNELSTNNLSQVELIKAPTPDQDADAIAGTINMVSKRYFDSNPGTRVSVELAGLKRASKAPPTQSSFGNYGRTIVSYNTHRSIFGESKNLGLAFDAAWSRTPRFVDNSGPRQSGSLSAVYLNPDSANPLTKVFSANEIGGAFDKFNMSLSADLRLKEGGYLYAKASYTTQNRDDSRYGVRSLGAGNSLGAFEVGSTFERSVILPNAANRIEVLSLNSMRKSRNILLSTGGELYILDGTTKLNFSGSYSHSYSKNPYFFNALAEVSGVGYEIDYRGKGMFQPAVVQRGGGLWTDAGNYRITTVRNVVTEGAPASTYNLRADLTREFDAGIPIEVKTGFKYTRRTNRDTRFYDGWTYVGEDGLPNTGDEFMGGRVGNVFSLTEAAYGPFPFLPMVTSKEQIAPASHWKTTAAQAYADITGASARGVAIWEDSPSAYLMASGNVGDVRIVGGLRAERTDVENDSWIRNATAQWGGNNSGGASVDPAVVAANIARAERSYVQKLRTKSSYTELFPGAHLVWEPKDGWMFRASYNRSIARPSIGQTLPTGNVNDETMVITIGNPDLKPYLSDNYELSFEKYFEPAGLVSVGVFRKDISRYFRTFSEVVGPEGIDGSGLYAGYERRAARNIGNAKVEGFEASYQQQFRGLPGVLSGMGAFANFTYLRAVGDFGSEEVTDRIPNMVPRSANFGLSYVGKGWQVRPLVNWVGQTYRGTSGTIDFDSQARTRVDLKIQKRFSSKYTLDIGIFNLTDEPDTVLVSSDGRLPFVEEFSGIAYSIGLSGRF